MLICWTSPAGSSEGQDGFAIDTTFPVSIIDNLRYWRGASISYLCFLFGLLLIYTAQKNHFVAKFSPPILETIILDQV